MEAILVVGVKAALNLPLLHPVDLRIEGIDLGEDRARAEIRSVPHLRHLLERGLVQATHHHLTALVALVTHHPAVRVADRDRLAALGAEPHGEDLDPGLGRSPGRRDRIAARGLLAVGEENKRLEAFLRRGEGRRGAIDGLRDGAPRVGHDLGTDRLDEEPRGLRIQGQRTLHEGRAREHDDPQAIAAQTLGEADHRPLRGGHAARPEVLGQHRGGGVDRHHDIDPFALEDREALPELRPGEGQNQGCGRREAKPVAHRTPGQVEIGDEMPIALGMGEGPRPPPPANKGQPAHDHEEEHDPEQIQVFRRGESHHGTLRNRVDSRRSTPASRMKAGSSMMGPSSS